MWWIKVIEMNKSEYVVWNVRFEPRPVRTFFSAAPFIWFCLNSLIMLSIISPQLISLWWRVEYGKRLAEFQNIRLNCNEEILRSGNSKSVYLTFSTISKYTTNLKSQVVRLIWECMSFEHWRRRQYSIKWRGCQTEIDLLSLLW